MIVKLKATIKVTLQFKWLLSVRFGRKRRRRADLDLQVDGPHTTCPLMHLVQLCPV